MTAATQVKPRSRPAMPAVPNRTEQRIARLEQLRATTVACECDRCFEAVFAIDARIAQLRAVAR